MNEGCISSAIKRGFTEENGRRSSIIAPILAADIGFRAPLSKLAPSADWGYGVFAATAPGAGDKKEYYMG